MWSRAFPGEGTGWSESNKQWQEEEENKPQNITLSVKAPQNIHLSILFLSGARQGKYIGWDSPAVLWSALQHQPYLVVPPYRLKFVIFWDFEEEVALKSCQFRIQCLSLPLPLLILPVNYSGTVHPNLDTESTFYFDGLFEDASIHPNNIIRYQAAGLSTAGLHTVELWWCKMAASWEQNKCYMYTLVYL